MKITCQNCGKKHDVYIRSPIRRYLYCECGANMIETYMKAEKEGKTMITIKTEVF